MNFFTKAVKTVRKAAGIPPITFGNVAKVASSAIPIPGLALAVNSITSKPKASEPNYVEQMKAGILNSAQQLGENIGVGLEAVDNYKKVTTAASTPVPIWLVAGAAALLLLGRK